VNKNKIFFLLLYTFRLFIYLLEIYLKLYLQYVYFAATGKCRETYIWPIFVFNILIKIYLRKV